MNLFREIPKDVWIDLIVLNCFQPRDVLNFGLSCRFFSEIIKNEQVQGIKFMKKYGDWVDQNAQLVSWSPDSRTLAFSQRNQIHLWDVLQGKEKKTLVVPHPTIEILLFSPTTSMILATQSAVSRNNSPTIIVWDVLSGSPCAQISCDSDVYSICFSPDGTILAASHCQKITLWDATSGTKQKETATNSTYIPIFYLPEGDYLVGLMDQTIQFWQVETLYRTNKFSPDLYYVRTVSLSSDGAYFLFSDWSGLVKVYNTVTFQNEAAFQVCGIVQSLAPLSGNSSLVLCITDETISVYNWRTGDQIDKIFETSDKIETVVCSPDGLAGAAVTVNGSFHIFAISGDLKDQQASKGKA